jgi:hypothetical protein
VAWDSGWAGVFQSCRVAALRLLSPTVLNGCCPWVHSTGQVPTTCHTHCAGNMWARPRKCLGRKNYLSMAITRLAGLRTHLTWALCIGTLRRPQPAVPGKARLQRTPQPATTTSVPYLLRRTADSSSVDKQATKQTKAPPTAHHHSLQCTPQHPSAPRGPQLSY